MHEENLRPDPSGPSQWKTLEQSPRSRRGLGESTILSVVQGSPVGQVSPWIAGGVAFGLLSMTIFVGLLVRRSVRLGMQESLQTVLEANVAALDRWLVTQKQTAEQYVSEDAIRDAITSSVDLVAAPDDDEARRLERLSDQLRARGYLGWSIINPIGTVVASSEESLLGEPIPLDHESFDRLNSGTAVVTHPTRLRSQDENALVVMCAIAPLQTTRKTVGSLALMIDPADQFTEILTGARLGDSGETYAFDRNAVLLSQSRFDPQLVAAGLLESGLTSPLHIELRVPESERGALDHDNNRSAAVDTPSVMQSSAPLTLMADRATRGGDGFDINGYPNYRGVPVIGTWRWLPEYDLGVATEIQVDEALATFRILETSFWTLTVAVIATGATLLAIAWINRPRDKDSDRVEELQRRLGQYDLQQRIGRGGMGTVYLGAHGLLERKVAIKVLENTEATERSLARFQREVQLSASLKHPNTIEIYDFGRTDDGTFFYVMEFVDGISLEQLVDYYGRQPAERVIYLLLQVCGSIGEAHEAGLVHRDIKPANILLTSRSGIHDLVKVLDFGLAKQLDHDSMQLTRVDSITGTPLFMSPESIRDAAAAGRLSDIYSIGAVGYTLLCGRPPFDGESSTDVCAKKLHEEPESPEQKVGAPLPLDLQNILMSCLRLDPKNRPQSIQELASQLAACTDSPHWTQLDAALWWREVFDGPYLDDFEMNLDTAEEPNRTRGDTAINQKRPAAAASNTTAH